MKTLYHVCVIGHFCNIGVYSVVIKKEEILYLAPRSVSLSQSIRCTLGGKITT